MDNAGAVFGPPMNSRAFVRDDDEVLECEMLETNSMYTDIYSDDDEAEFGRAASDSDSPSHVWSPFEMHNIYMNTLNADGRRRWIA